MTPPIELRHLRYFVAVAEEASFGRAAARLGIAQPPLSQQIAQLETRIGRRLFDRRPRVALTAAGQVLLPAARRQLALLHQSIEATRLAGAAGRTVLQVGIASSAILLGLPLLLRRFCTAHPRVEIRLKELHSAEQIVQLGSGALDLAILREPGPDETFVTEAIVREPLAAVLPAGHAGARRPQVPLKALALERFVLFPRASAPTLYDQIVAACAESGFAPRVEQEAREWHTVLGLVAAGFGVSVAPLGVRGLRLAGVAVRPLRPGTARVALFVCHPREAASPAAAQLAAWLRTRVRGEARR